MWPPPRSRCLCQSGGLLPTGRTCFLEILADLWAAACRAEGVSECNWLKLMNHDLYTGTGSDTWQNGFCLCEQTEKALKGKWTHQKHAVHQSQIAMFEAFYLPIAACLTHKKTVHLLVCLNSCGETCQTTLLVFIQDWLSGKCDVNWSRASWWQCESGAR